MQLHLQDLINKIKVEGLEEAEAQARQIREKADAQAKVIIENAKNDAEKIIIKAKNDAQRIKDAGEKTLQQSARNLLIELRVKIIALFDQLLHNDIKNAITVSELKTMIIKIAENWNPQTQGLEVLLSKQDLELLQNGFLQKLRTQFHEGVLIKPANHIDKGFFIGEKNKNVHYDFSDQGLFEMISQYLNPYLSDILKNDNKDGSQ